MTQIHSADFTISGHPIHTLQAGKPEDPCLIFLHGMAFKAETWKELGTINLLAECGFFVLALDLPGFGSSPQADITPEQVLLTTLKEHNVSNPILVGPSMGGRIALEFALDHPQTLNGLVLIGAVGVEENKGRLAGLGVRTLIVWGENDHISAPANANILHTGIADSQLSIIKKAKHACYLEQKDVFHKELLAFCKSLQQNDKNNG